MLSTRIGHLKTVSADNTIDSLPKKHYNVLKNTDD